ncbi:ribose 5-phosphate isomerase B [Martelella alba]|nr:ribose 5-phosphate isomerase B [Martelella alba]
MRIAIGCDHVGFLLKKDIMDYLIAAGCEVIDKGTYSTERTDYPVYGKAVARAVLNKEADLGIVMCGTGVGISIAANKLPGIRAVVCSEPYSAKLSRQHNDTNILAFGSRVVGSDLAKMIVDSWLTAEFEGGRHQRRIDSLEE